MWGSLLPLLGVYKMKKLFLRIDTINAHTHYKLPKVPLKLSKVLGYYLEVYGI